jgi:hypothetical protein
MARTSRRTGAKKSKKPPTVKGAVKAGFRAKIRMYRQGLGDCFLVTLPRKEGKPFFMLVDCGVVLGTEEPSSLRISSLRQTAKSIC